MHVFPKKSMTKRIILPIFVSLIHHSYEYPTLRQYWQKDQVEPPSSQSFYIDPFFRYFCAFRGL